MLSTYTHTYTHIHIHTHTHSSTNPHTYTRTSTNTHTYTHKRKYIHKLHRTLLTERDDLMQRVEAHQSHGHTYVSSIPAAAGQESSTDDRQQRAAPHAHQGRAPNGIAEQVQVVLFVCSHVSCAKNLLMCFLCTHALTLWGCQPWWL